MRLRCNSWKIALRKRGANSSHGRPSRRAGSSSWTAAKLPPGSCDRAAGGVGYSNRARRKLRASAERVIMRRNWTAIILIASMSLALVILDQFFQPVPRSFLELALSHKHTVLLTLAAPGRVDIRLDIWSSG